MKACLKNVAERFSHFWITKEIEAREDGLIYFGIIVMFVMGGALGTLTVSVYNEKAVGLVDSVLVIVFILLYLEKRKEYN